MTGSRPSAGAAERSIYLTLRRVIDAPVEAVYAAWTESEQLRRWLAPGSATVVRAVAEVEVGGTFLVEMRGPDGRKYLTRGRYLEVVPQVRLVHTWCWEGSEVETLLTVEFERAASAKTRVTLTHSRFLENGDREEHRLGWTMSLSKLEGLWGE